MTPEEWIRQRGNLVGSSSATIWSALTGEPMPFGWDPDVPVDVADFKRCKWLIDEMPGWRARLDEVAIRYPIWTRYVADWAEMERLYETDRDRLYGHLSHLRAPASPGDYVADARGPIVTMYPSGAELHPFDASPDEIHLEDIAHGLSLVCRFGGAVREFYSVAQHSVLVSRLVAETVCFECEDVPLTQYPQLRKLALLHDAAEYVFGDMTAPVKSRCYDYKVHEEAFEARVFRRFGIEKTPTLWKIVKTADRFMRRVEADFLGKARMAHDEREAVPVPIEAGMLLDEAWSPVFARTQFLAEFRSIESMNR
jgi:hypothetical protein